MKRYSMTQSINLKDFIIRMLLVVICSVYIVSVFGATGYAAISPQQKFMFQSGILYADAQASAFCEGGSTSATSGGTFTNLDYAGNKIFTDAQLEAIGENQSTYEQAADQVDIPWQMIAVIHLRETGLKRINPINGQGIYQFVSKQGGPYPNGPVDDAEFLRQTILAAEFIKSKASINYPPNQELTKSSGPAAIKDTFFGYNGRSSVYAEQAASLGYDPETEAYEGSPYVMNKADAKRDPVVSPTTWGQIKVDFGGIEYPANGDYGAFVYYAALAGVAFSGSCSSTNSGTTRERVLALAQRELALWNSGELQPGTDFHKYSEGDNFNWCTHFVSWIFREAGYPMTEQNNGIIPAVQMIADLGEDGGKFTYHDASNYVPKPGDVVVQQGNGAWHVAIVSAVENPPDGVLKVSMIGGNHGGGEGSGGYKLSVVSELSYTGTSNGMTTGYVSYK